MPYKSNQDLPDSVQSVLPPHAQDIYREALNHALEEYKDPSKRRDNSPAEKIAYKVAWAAVKTKYFKTSDGSWERIKGK